MRQRRRACGAVQATAIQVFCRGGRFRGAERFSRHWYDVASLDNTAYVASALADRDLARRVAEQKTMFFRERDGRGDVIDYNAVMGALQLAPDGPAQELLAADYAGMVNDGLLFEKPPLIAELVARCRTIQDRANNVGRAASR